MTAETSAKYMRFFYDIIFLLFSLAYLPYLVIKGKAHKDFAQRFGFLPGEVKALDRPVWIHAVSVGEASLASKLAAKIKSIYPSVKVAVSTTTRTGNEVIKQSLGKEVDACFYYPVDLSFVVSGVVKRVNPRMYVMIETELWPNLLLELSKKGVPVVLANGRISDRSFGNYKKVKFITKRLFGCVNLVCAQSGRDAERAVELGAKRENVVITGSMKFDDSGSARAEVYSRSSLGFGDKGDLLVAGSTHYPEERKIIAVYKKLREKGRDLGLVIAPRHVERAQAIAHYLRENGLSFSTFSALSGRTDKGGSGVDVLLVDTIGHLKDIYGAASLIFIGGSLAKKGGQNPIEGARLGKTVIFGPDMSNFREVASILVDNDSGIMVKDDKELFTVIDRLLSDDIKRARIGENAKRIVSQNSGALERTVGRMRVFLEK